MGDSSEATGRSAGAAEQGGGNGMAAKKEKKRTSEGEGEEG